MGKIRAKLKRELEKGKVVKDHADDYEDGDHDDGDDDDDDQGTVEGGSRLSVDKRERTPSLLHLVGFFYLFTLIWF